MTRKKNIPLKSYVILSLIGALCFVIYLKGTLAQDLLGDLRVITVNLGTGIMVVLLTMFLIESIISGNQEKERKKYQSVALQQLEIPLVHQLYLLFYIFKASLETKPEKTYRNVRDLFDDNFFNHLAFFDFSKEAPIYGPVFGGTQWYDYISHECKEFVDALDRTISKYALYLDSEIIEVMENVINSRFISFVIKAPISRDFWKELRRDKEYEPLCTFFAAPGMCDEVREYTNLFTRLVEHYNELLGQEKAILIRISDDELWKSDFVPIGSGRVTKKVV